LALYSQEFDNAYWTKTNATISANSTVAPDGTTTADTVTTAGGLLGNVIRSFTIANDSLTRVFSIFIKKETVSSFGVLGIVQTGGTARNTAIQYNKQTGVAQYVGNGFGSGYTAPISFSVADAGQFWRMSVSIDNNSTGNTTLVVNNFVNYGTSFGNFTAVDGTAVIWQAQLETGSVATSPIVTTAGTASRVADVVSLTGASSLIGQTAGTLYVEVDWRNVTGVQQNIITTSDGSAGNRMEIVKLTNDELSMVATANGSSQTSQGQASGAYSGIQKIAFGYALNDAILYRNGSSISTDTSFDLSAGATRGNINLGASRSGTAQANMWIRSVALFPTRLADATLASITS
jgi:hypothetical protein